MHSLPNRIAHARPTSARRGFAGSLAWLRRHGGDLLYVAMMSTGWVAGNVLALFGCVVAAFVLIADGDFNAFMAQIDNVASRYDAAGPERRAGFEHDVLVTLAICGALLVAIRVPRFINRLRLELSQERRS